MISWIVIGILLVVGIFAIKMNHLRHRIFIVVLIVLALFLYSTLVLVDNRNDLNLSTSDGLFDALKVYNGWLANGFGNMKSLTGRAIGMDWSSTNGSFFNKTDTDNK